MFFDNAENKLPQSNKFENLVSKLNEVCTNMENLKSKYNKQNEKNDLLDTKLPEKHNSHSKRDTNLLSSTSKSKEKYERKNKNILNCQIDYKVRKLVEEKLETLHIELRKIFDNLNELNKEQDYNIQQSQEINHDSNVEVLK